MSLNKFQVPWSDHRDRKLTERLDRERHRLAVFGYGALASNDRPTTFWEST